ncbi:hypothetical protein ACN2C3_03385 [Aliarcobacter butzleri]
MVVEIKKYEKLEPFWSRKDQEILFVCKVRFYNEFLGWEGVLLPSATNELQEL